VKATDLNNVLLNFEKLLRRTIREDVELSLLADPGIPAIRADVGQIEQVVMYLVVNAQDAMPGGGRITIETGITVLDEADLAPHEGAEPGRHVMLALSDMGEGMDDRTLDRIFEPFFTTKERGKGTGLGLSTVYGIVKQHRGITRVDSEPGKGTTFTLYFPALGERLESIQSTLEDTSPSIASGTVLVVEDDEGVRQVAVAGLQRMGYSVLSASSGADCLRLLEEHGHTVDLLLTDVIMADMNGKELYARAASLSPNLKVLFMSG
jgi:two-component system, cell cycle sensor histidine kinase and response regulator CckA